MYLSALIIRALLHNGKKLNFHIFSLAVWRSVNLGLFEVWKTLPKTCYMTQSTLW